MRRRRIVDDLMDEVVLYGGLPVRRGDVYADAFARTGSAKAADAFAFGMHVRRAPVGALPLSRAELSVLR